MAAELSAKPAVMMLTKFLVVMPPDVEQMSMLGTFSPRISDGLLSGSSVPLLECLLASNRINTPYVPGKLSL